MRHAAIAGWLVTLSIAAVAPQGPASSVVEGFDVASIKVNRSGAREISLGLPGGGRFTATNAPLMELIRVAYDMPDFLIADAPDWIRTERYDIAAKVEGAPDTTQLFLMVRTLLADRFNLRVHTEKREQSAYALVRLKSDGSLGPRLRPATTDCVALRNAVQKGAAVPRSNRLLCGVQVRPDALVIGGRTMEQIANSLSQQLRRAVVDRTGLDGSFDADLGFAAIPPPGVTDAPPPSDAPSIFTAVQEQLGLKLDPMRAPVDVLVIDGVGHPTED